MAICFGWLNIQTLFLQALVQAMWPWYSTGLDIDDVSANNAHNEEDGELELK